MCITAQLIEARSGSVSYGRYAGHQYSRKFCTPKEILRDIDFVDYWHRRGKWGGFVRSVGDDEFEAIGPAQVRRSPSIAPAATA